ncbi:MAG TPA: hypothetical protein VFC23_09790, partial [Thermoanaerobaculia bacterium]|nr:hypothetical protein [Thermoanaerobaculia bacterium]
MQRRPKRPLPFLTLAAVLFLAVSFHSTPSDPAIPAAHELPASSGAPRTEDLAHWMATGGSSSPSGFHAFRAEDLSGAPAGRRHLGLFPTGSEAPDAAKAAEAQRRFLYRLPYGAAIAIAAQ